MASGARAVAVESQRTSSAASQRSAGWKRKGEKNKKSPKKVAKVASGQAKMLSDSASKASGIKCIEYVLNIQSRPLSSVVLGRSR